VVISWRESEEKDVDRWLLAVEDTGPGFHEAPGSPIAGELSEATEAARQTEVLYPVSGVEPVPEAGAPASPPPFMRPGEGIGLLIVKRLCELLEATFELTSTREGTTFQVVLPRRYSSAHKTG
jgi:signal transduction histidine kinase